MNAMKKNILLSGLLCLAISLPVLAQTQQVEQPGKRSHIRMVTVKDGVTTVTDTVIVDGIPARLKKGNQGFVFLQDSLGTIDWEQFAENDSAGTFVFRRRFSGDRPFMMHRFGGAADSVSTEIFRIERGKAGEEDIRVIRRGRPGMNARPGIPAVPFDLGDRQLRVLQHRSGNVINLSDPDIISYKKKKLSGGREKVTIIRKDKGNSGE